MKTNNQNQSPKKPKINPHLLKLIKLIILTLLGWLNPEVPLAIFLVNLLFIVVGWLNDK